MMGAFVRLAGATSLCCALAGDAHAQAKSAPGGELRYPLSLSVGELSDRFGIGLAMGDEADRPPAFPHVCYGYGGVAVYHLSVSQVFLARYLGRGFTRESLCLALVSGVRFDPDTGRRLPTYVVVFPEWAKTILEEARREKAGRERTRDMLAAWYINSRGLTLLTYRTITALGQGKMPGPEQSLAKLVAARQAQEIADFCLDIAGESGALKASELGDAWKGVERAWAWGAAMRIAGGTDEILRNIIAERVLNLPPEPRADKGAPARSS